MFKKLRSKLFDFNVLELKKNHYYILVVKNSEDVQEIGDALNLFLGDAKDAPKFLVLSGEELEEMRVIEIG